jgi:MoaA/NifB/PqqE/SkfB family radical SAM enzyme
MKTRAMSLAQPLTVHAELTYSCNWRCVFCYNPRHFDLKRMSGEEWLAVLDDLRTLGTLTVALTGGEPLTHPDFFDIAAGARERSFAIRIFTNGTLIKDQATAARIAALNPLSVELSIHGATAETHDKVTAKAGSFEAMLAAIARLRETGVTLLLKAPVTNLNEHEVEGIVAIAERFAVPLQLDPTLTPRDDGDMAPLNYTISREGLKRLTALGIRTGNIPQLQRNEGDANCGLGRITMAIDPEGNVYPCIQWRHKSLGNVRQTPLRELWHASAVREEAVATSLAANEMLRQRGGVVSEFPFCPATAFQRMGDPLGLDADFVERAEMASAVRSELAAVDE